jgi:hypothetical protein
MFQSLGFGIQAQAAFRPQLFLVVRNTNVMRKTEQRNKKKEVFLLSAPNFQRLFSLDAIIMLCGA